MSRRNDVYSGKRQMSLLEISVDRCAVRGVMVECRGKGSKGKMKERYKRRFKAVRKVLVLARLKYSSGRKFLSGLFNYLSDGHACHLKLLQEPEELTAETIRNAKQECVDGMILSIPGTQESMQALAKSDIPAIFVNIDDEVVAKRRNASFIWTDNADIAQAGVNHLMSCGNFMSFAYIHALPESASWSEERAKAFHAALQRKGRSACEFAPRVDAGSEADIAALARFLAGLPKPAAVMAAFDWRATHVLDACDLAGLDVPRQVAVLGVDNDEFCCPYSNPPLSSVQPDFAAIGEKAASELGSLLQGRRGKGCKHIRIGSAKVIARESTAPIAPATSLVRHILSIVREHAHEGITPSDVARRLGVSRRLADLRLSEMRGETLKSVIEGERLSRVRQLLKTTSRTTTRIAAEAGFKSATHLSHLFRKRFGMSMLEYRKARR